MESGPLSTPEFKEFAKDVVLFCHITTRIKGRKHDDLLSQVGGRGFPHLVFMDGEGKVVGQPAGRSVESFQQGARYLILERKENPTQAETLELIELGLGSGAMKPADAKERAAKLKLDKAQRAKVDDLIKAAEGQAKIAAILGQLKSQADMQTKGAKLGKELWALYQEGVRAPKGSREALGMFQLMIEYGATDKVLEPAQTGLAGLQEALGKEPRAKQFLSQVAARVKALEDELKK